MSTGEKVLLDILTEVKSMTVDEYFRRHAEIADMPDIHVTDEFHEVRFSYSKARIMATVDYLLLGKTTQVSTINSSNEAPVVLTESTFAYLAA